MPATAIKSYYAASRAPRYSVLFALPLFVLYEAMALALAPPAGQFQVRNGAEVILAEVSEAAAGARGPLILMGAIIALSIWLVWRDRKRSNAPIEPRVFALMFAESAVLAVLFGLVVGTVTAKLLGSFHALVIPPLAADTPIERMGGATKLMLALGAGLFEELLFRVLLVGAIAALGRTVLGLGRGAAGTIAVVIGALVFSAFHYIGAYGDPWQLQSFVFRAISGVAFSALYLTRGFGITAWTHALYDVWVLLVI